MAFATGLAIPIAREFSYAQKPIESEHSEVDTCPNGQSWRMKRGAGECV